MPQVVAWRLLKTSRTVMDLVATVNILSRSTISNDICPPGSKRFFRPVRWRSKKKRGMPIRTRKRAIGAHSSNASSWKSKHLIKLISERKRISFSWNQKNCNSASLVRSTMICVSQAFFSLVLEFLDIAQSHPLPEVPEENVTIFHSDKTGLLWACTSLSVWKTDSLGRGPLQTDWFERMKKIGRKDGMMCAYKLCRVEFRYWGMQSKCERFIHEIALRKTLIRAHRQAWCWQDEYQGLSLADIRRLEDETQRELSKRMAQFRNESHRLSITHSNSNQENFYASNENSSAKHQATTTTTMQRPRRMSIDNMNASRPKMNAFPVPALIRDDQTEDEEFFDAECKFHSYSSSRRWRNVTLRGVAVCTVKKTNLKQRVSLENNEWSSRSPSTSAELNVLMSYCTRCAHQQRADSRKQNGKDH